MQLNKTDIIKLIKVRKADNFWNHLVYALKKNYKPHGEVQVNSLKVWQKTYFTGVLYPVYTFEFNAENQLIKTTDKLNSFGKLARLLFPFAHFIPLLKTTFTNFELIRFLVGITLFLILMLAYFLVCNTLYQYEKKEQLRNFNKILNIEIKEELQEEWSAKKILKRILIYPFCFAIILTNIFLLIPEGNLYLAISTLGVVGLYLYSDLKIIFKQRN